MKVNINNKTKYPSYQVMKKNVKTTRKTEKDIRNKNHHKPPTLLKDLSLKNNIPLSDWEEKELDADNMFELHLANTVIEWQ